MASLVLLLRLKFAMEKKAHYLCVYNDLKIHQVHFWYSSY